jgi:SAM-dependent methyltransferase
MSETAGKAANPLAAPEPWDIAADGYNEKARGFLDQFSRSGLAMLSYGPETRAIDIACGPGTTTLLLAPSVRHVTCVDFSAGMIDQLRRNVAAAGLRNVEAIQADGQALPFPDDGFDMGVSMFGLMFFPDRARGFAELRRVLAPGGQALVSSWLPTDRSSFMRTIFAALAEDDAPPPAPLPPGLEDRTVFEAELREAGFADIRIEAVEHGAPVDDVERFWGDMVRGVVPVAVLKSRSTEAEWQRIERRALGRLHEALAGRLPTSLSSTAWLATARKP